MILRANFFTLRDIFQGWKTSCGWRCSVKELQETTLICTCSREQDLNSNIQAPRLENYFQSRVFVFVLVLFSKIKQMVKYS